MKREKNSGIGVFNNTALYRNIVLGAGIGLILMGLLLLQVKDPNPEWSKLWVIRPLLVVALAGGAGGSFYYFTDQLSRRRNWNVILTMVFCLLVYLIGLWMGFVLGLDGTLWD